MKNPFQDPHVQALAFARSEHFLALHNHAPILPGHSLVIPKRPIQRLMALSELELLEFVMLSRRCVRILQQAFGTEDFDWTIQEGPYAGQTVPHLHLHVIPRQKEDLPEPGDWYPRLEQQYREGVIDSQARPRLSQEEQRRISRHLQEIARQQGL